MYGYAYSITYFCQLFGKSRQAFYEQKNNDNDSGLTEAIVLKLVREIRTDLPRCGTSKLHFMLQEKLVQHHIKLGRDGLYDLLGKYGLLIRYRHKKPRTTHSFHHYKKYPNLIKEMILTQAGMLWVSDITYIAIANVYAYLSIITDAYSHKIVGYKLHPTLHAQGAIDALIMASKELKKQASLFIIVIEEFNIAVPIMCK